MRMHTLVDVLLGLDETGLVQRSDEREIVAG